MPETRGRGGKTRRSVSSPVLSYGSSLEDALLSEDGCEFETAVDGSQTVEEGGFGAVANDVLIIYGGRARVLPDLNVTASNMRLTEDGSLYVGSRATRGAVHKFRRRCEEDYFALPRVYQLEIGRRIPDVRINSAWKLPHEKRNRKPNVRLSRAHLGLIQQTRNHLNTVVPARKKSIVVVVVHNPPIILIAEEFRVPIVNN